VRHSVTFTALVLGCETIAQNRGHHEVQQPLGIQSPGNRTLSGCRRCVAARSDAGNRKRRLPFHCRCGPGASSLTDCRARRSRRPACCSPPTAIGRAFAEESRRVLERLAALESVAGDLRAGGSGG
jgi:hypothetical protein